MRGLALECAMIVEQTREYPLRMRYDPETRSFSATSSQSLGAARGFPYPYGWIAESGAPPGPHWDALLMSEKDFALGDRVAIRVIGVFLRGDGDHKLVAVERERAVDDIALLTEAERESLARLYPRVGPGEGWFGREEALRTLRTREKPL